MKTLLIAIIAAAIAACASIPAKPAEPATQATRALKEGEVCGTDDRVQDPREPQCGPRLVCIAQDTMFGVKSSGLGVVRTCQSQPFFGAR